MLWLVIQCGAAVVAMIAVAGFYFTRSSKDLPKNFQQLRSEIQWQIMGIYGLTEDFIMRPKNRVELYSQPGRLVIITGGNRGIGLQVVEKLLKCDMTVIMGVRNPDQAKKNLEGTVDISKIKGKIIYEELDTGSLESVQKFATKIKSNFSKIDILINNAGIMAAPYAITEDGFESQFAVNYLGHFLLTHLLLPELKAAGTESVKSRIVNVSSCIHLFGTINFDDINSVHYYYPPDAYNQSKLAQVLFTKELQRILDAEEAPVQIHAVHPGVVDTDLFCHSSTTYIPWFKKLFFKNTEEGSRTIVYAAISPKIEGKSGTYMSNCSLVKMSSLAKDKAYCERFFKFTCKELLDINVFGKPSSTLKDYKKIV